MIGRLLVVLLWPPWVAAATPWSLSESLTVAEAAGVTHYHHLDGAGRKHLAATEAAVALVWEDDRSGAPQVYVAVKRLADAAFTRIYRLSYGAEAYEPAIVALDAERWVAVWEQDGSIHGCVIDATGAAPAQRLAAQPARQATLVTDGRQRVAAIWARGEGRGQVIEVSELQVERTAIKAGPVSAVAPVGGQPFQAYPAAWLGGGRLVIAWEDRRAGHTRLFYAWRDGQQPFAPARQLNEHNAPPASADAPVRLGSGVMRVALAGDRAAAVQAVWLDKRNPSSGYAVWGARSDDGGKTFGANRQVQDDLGAAVPQWHASVAAGPRGFVAVWDDTREAWEDASEAGDVVLSWQSGTTAWSEDLVVPGASGQGYQGSPVLALDPRGDLHLAWIERDDLSAPTRLRYLHGRAVAPSPRAATDRSGSRDRQVVRDTGTAKR